MKTMNQKRYIKLFSLDDLQEQKIEICLNDFQMFKKNEIKNRRPDLGLKGSLKRHQEKKNEETEVGRIACTFSSSSKKISISAGLSLL